MSVVSITATQGDDDFELLCTGAVRNYSFNPADLSGQREAEGIKQKLIAQLEDTVRELELQSDRTIAKIYIGKTYILRRRRVGGGCLNFDPLDHHTWRKKGISSRWQDHKKQDYGRDGLVVLGAITRETMPESCSQEQQEDFALAMEQKLLHHYLLSHPDPRVVNETFSTEATTEQKGYAYAVYMAFRYEDETISEEEAMDTSPSFLIQANDHDQSTSSAQRPTPFLSDTSYMNSMQPSIATTDDVVLLPSNIPAHQFSSPSPTRRPQVTFSSLPLPDAGLNNQLASKQTMVKSNTSCPSTPRGRGILKEMPEKQPQHQPFTFARNLIPAFNSERMPHDDGRANLPHTVNTSPASGSSNLSCQLLSPANELEPSTSPTRLPSPHHKVEFSELCTATVRGYSFNLVDLAMGTSTTTMELKLIEQLNSTVRELEYHSCRRIDKIYIGKTYIPQSERTTFDHLNPDTWKMDGISSRWSSHRIQDYGRDGLVVLCAVIKENVPEGSRMSQEDLTLALEQKLLHHYLLDYPDRRVINKTLTTGHLAQRNHHAYAVYIAFRYADEEFSNEEAPNEPNDPFFLLEEAADEGMLLGPLESDLAIDDTLLDETETQTRKDEIEDTLIGEDSPQRNILPGSSLLDGSHSSPIVISDDESVCDDYY